MPGPLVLLTTEGTYPYHLGGVSTWCDMLVHQVPETEFILFVVAMNPYVTNQFTMPPSVRSIITIPLWGTQDPSEHRQVPFSEIFLQKQRTTQAEVERSFLPIFREHLRQFLNEGAEPDVAGQVYSSMHRYFQFYDYRATFKSKVVWDMFRDWVLESAERGYWPEPSVHEAVEALGWLYHFYTVLNTELPQVDVVHSSAAAFCGLAGVVAKQQMGTPYLLTEHGVYLREQYLSVGRSNMSAFSKRFLLSVVRTLTRVNLYYADEVLPVCAFNARWERVLGTDMRKIHVIYNGVSPDVFVPAKALPARPSERIEVLSIARMDPNKDIETLLRAVAIARVHIPGLHVSVRGSVSVPAYHERMVMLREELQLSDVVDFYGHTESIAAAYREADIVVQSSVSEAFPYSVIEAMMSGVAVVATDVGGTGEALKDAGILVPARDPAQLALGLVMLARDSALRVRLGQAARERALSFFTTQQVVRNYHDRYRRHAGHAFRVVDLRSRQKLVLERAYALRRLGLAVAALDQLERALRVDPGGRAGPAILAQIATLEGELGLSQRSALHLIGAWMLQNLGQVG